MASTVQHGGPVDVYRPGDAGPKLTQSHEGEHREDFSGKTMITAKTYAWATCAAINSCNLGYDIGVNTVAAPLVKDHFDLSNFQLQMFVGSLNFVAMVGALSANLVTDRYGRRKAFTAASITFVLGVILQSAAQSLTTLMAGRVFVGLGVGFGLALDPLYIAEISPASRRGELVTWAEIATNLGIVFGFVSGIVFEGTNSDVAWRYMFALGAIMPCLMIYFANYVLAESPRWLMAKGDRAQAESVLKEIYGKYYDVTPIMKDIDDAITRESQAGNSVGWSLIFCPPPSFRRMLIVGISIAVAQQAVGIDAIQYFALFILEESGVDSSSDRVKILICLGVLKLFFIIVGGRFFDRRGRRPLFFLSLGGMAIAHLMLSINFFGVDSGGLSVFALALYFAMFSIGMGPGAWLIPSEIFATCIRAKAMSLATFLNRLTAGLFASTFLTTADAMTYGGFFLTLFFLCVVLLGYIYCVLPETKGRSLEDMLVYFAEITGDQSILDVEARLAKERQDGAGTDKGREMT